MIIGGHSHVRKDTLVNNIPIYQAGAYLDYLGKISIQIDSAKVLSYQYDEINLENYPSEDPEIAASIAASITAARVPIILHQSIALLSSTLLTSTLLESCFL